MRSQRFLLDTNIILRFLLRDHRTLSKKAQRIFSMAEAGKIELVINHTTVAEVFWVLKTVYDVPKTELVSLLTELISFPHVKIPKKRLVLKALEILGQCNISYVDAYNLAYARGHGLGLHTFDKKLSKAFKRSGECDRSRNA